MNTLYEKNSAARSLRKTAAAVLVFPDITKGGFLFGGMGGKGTMFRRDGTVIGHYQTIGFSYGLQAGVQRYGYALFIMDERARANLNAIGGWEIGSSPSLVVVNEGVAASLTTSTVQDGVYAFFFNQTGLMGGVSLEGTKITRIHPPG